MSGIISFLIFYLLEIIAGTKGDPNIVITKNEGGFFEIPEKSLIKFRIGTNFSLICVIMDNKSGKLLPGPLVWSKNNGQLKFFNSQDSKSLEQNNISQAYLNFTSVSIKDQGEYFCVSPKYKLSKRVFVLVRPKFTSVGFKRNRVKYWDPRRKRFADNYGPDWKAEDLPSIDLYEKLREHADNDLYAELGIKHVKIPEGVNNMLRDYKTDFLEKPEKKSKVIEADDHQGDPTTTFFIICLLAVALLIYMFYIFFKINVGVANNSRVSLISDIRHLHERIRRFRASNRGNSELNRNDDDFEVLQPGVHFTNNTTNAPVRRLDDKDAQDLPPSYEEVVASTVTSAPPSYDSYLMSSTDVNLRKS